MNMLAVSCLTYVIVVLQLRSTSGQIYGTWSQWYNRDRPSGTGDYEDVVSISQTYGHNVCGGDTPLSAECREVGSDITFSSNNLTQVRNILANPCTITGLTCINNDQIGDVLHTCQDYEVRFLCPSSEENPTETPTYPPSTTKVTFKHIKWDTLGLPQLVFNCTFALGDDNLWYSVIWSVNGTQIKETVVQEGNLEDADLTENDLTTLGYRHGISIVCQVSNKTEPEAPASHTVTSEPFFAGIKIYNSTMFVPEDGKASIMFEPTVPFACKSGVTSCELRIEMKKIDSNTCEEIGTGSSRCRTIIKGHDDDATMTNFYTDEQWRKQYPMSIEHRSSTDFYRKADHFTLALYTDKVDHEFWSEVRLPDITVKIDQRKIWKGKKCYGHVDPHMKTFDGRRFENQDLGDYLLYRNKENGQQVQYRNQNCGPYYPRAYCMCSVAIQAGRTVFLIDICNTRKIVDFQLCEENTLTVKSDRDKYYVVNFPTGTEVLISLVQFGRFRHFNIDIFPSAKDVGKTEGLCNLLNHGNIWDFHKRDGTITNQVGEFINDWKLSNGENLLLDEHRIIPKSQNMYDSLSRWDVSAISCHCKFDQKGTNRPEYHEVRCSKTVSKNCAQTARYSNFNCYVKSIRRKRRDVSWLTSETQTSIAINKKKRSVPQVMAEVDARFHCESAINASESYHVCMTSVQEMDDSYVNDCVLDLMLTGDTNLTDEAVQLFNDACLTYTRKNLTLQQENPEVVSIVYTTTCPNNCSNHGLCDGGSCVCTNGFTGSDCSRNVSTPPTVIYLSDNGLCDLADGPCDDIFVYGDDFLPTQTTKCKFDTQHVLTDNTIVDMGSIVENGTQRSLFEGVCSPSSDNTANVFVTMRNLSVANDGISFSDHFPLYIFDSTCQQLQNESGMYSFTLKNDFCFINGRCVQDGTHQYLGTCLGSCNTTNSLFDWSDLTGCGDLPLNPVSSTPSNNRIILYVVSAVTTVIVIAVVVVAICIKGKLFSRGGDKHLDPFYSFPDVRVSDNKNPRFDPNSRPQSARTISEDFMLKPVNKGPDLSRLLAK